MNYYEEKKSERRNRRTAIFLTTAIYFILFTGVFFTARPELLPEVVKEWLNIDSSINQEEIKKELPSNQTNKKKERA